MKQTPRLHYGLTIWRPHKTANPKRGINNVAARHFSWTPDQTEMPGTGMDEQHSQG